MEGYGQSPDVMSEGILAAAGAVTLIGLLIVLLILISMWKIFTKAGRPGWEGIIPIYNFYILIIHIIKQPMSWFWIIIGLVVGSMIPILGMIFSLALFVMGIFINIKLAKAFGKSTAFGVAASFFSFIFYPILAFDSSVYMPPIDQSNAELKDTFSL